MVLELRVFAFPTELRWNGQPVKLRPMERVLILALWTASGYALPAAKLEGKLWGGAGDVVAVTLRSHVAHIRKALCAAGCEAAGRVLATVPVRGGGYRLELDRACVDASRFEDLIVLARSRSRLGLAEEAMVPFEEALRMWDAGPLSDAAEWRFAKTEIGRLESLRRDARVDLAEIRVRQGDYSAAVSDLRDLTQERPQDGPGWELLVAALWGGGHDAEAINAGKQAIAEFRRRGLDPAGLERLHCSVLNGTFPRAFNASFTGLSR
jgi:DNA-binding SARP family transcriptional activator